MCCFAQCKNNTLTDNPHEISNRYKISGKRFGFFLISKKTGIKRMTPKKSLEEILTPADQTGIPGLIKDSGGRFQHISKIKLILLDF
jgi:hypothetical protein